MQALTTPRLMRARDCSVAGVAGGLAAHLGWRVRLVRAGFVLLALCSGFGVLLYAWLWAFTPWAEPAGVDEQRIVRRLPVAWMLAALTVLAGLSALFVLIGSGEPMNAIAPIAIAIACAIAAGCWTTLIDRSDPERGRRAELSIRITVTAVLVIVIITLLRLPYDETTRQSAAMSVVLSFVTALGIVLVYAPALITLVRDLNRERVGRIRDEQRAEIAAHLHDSVLQTLALIQNRAGASSEAGRLARAQERELRSWLFEGDSVADSDLAADLRDFASALELDYPVRIDVVAVGSGSERSSGDLAAAAREAMLNAARHAGGEVSVYIESSARAVDVYVRDRGPGFAPAEVASDRLGVRESIIGRMRRAGGTASVGPGAGGTGTEVHLGFETAGDARG